MNTSKYPENVFPPEIHQEIQLFYSKSQSYCYGINKIELEKLKKENEIQFLFQLEDNFQIKLYKLQVFHPYITDVYEYIGITDLDIIDEKWHRRKIK